MEYVIETGSESDLMHLISKFARQDANTVMMNWRHAARRNHLLIIHSAAMGYTVVSIVPPNWFTLAEHKVPQKYQLSWLGQHIKPKHMYIFGTDIALEQIIDRPKTLNPFEMEETNHGRTEQSEPRSEPRAAIDTGAADEWDGDWDASDSERKAEPKRKPATTKNTQSRRKSGNARGKSTGNR